MNYSFLGAFCLLLFLSACGKEQALPILGEKTYVERQDADGNTAIDSITQPMPKFSLLNQRGEEVSEAQRDGKIAVVDFFFTSCPSICPKVKKQMLRVQEQYGSNPDIVVFSHSIDAKRDSVGRLAWYAERLGIEMQNWHLLYGELDEMQRLARHYLLSAVEDPEAPGGFDHSGALTLIDRKGRIRGLYEGTDEKRVSQLLLDIQKLLDEKK